jgi:protein-tyrosine kinase
MDVRTRLVERAAALLREKSPESSSDSAALSSTVTSTPHLTRAMPPIGRKVVLDRGLLSRTGIAMPWTTTARVVEEFRIVKRNIMFPWQLREYPSAANRPPRVVMVTSSRPKEGKTFCAINLALAFAAEENLVTILLDSDTVRSTLSKLLQIRPHPGFTDLLSKEHRLEDVLIETDLPNLILLPPGSHGPHVPELLHGRAPSLVFAEIARCYPEHVILIDTAPCLASSDPVSFAPLASQVVFVIEAGNTQQSEIEASLNLLSGSGPISFLLNKAPDNSSQHFGSYSYYYNTDATEQKARDD